jgi:hypothetical protein
MSMVNIDWRPDSKGLRKFGLVVLIGCGIIGLVFQFGLEKETAAKVVYIVGAVVGLTAITGSKIGLPGYWVWMGFAFVMGNVMSRVLLTIVYFGLFTPMGFFMRLFGRDSLSLKKPQAQTYWRDMEPPAKGPAGYERQF